MRGRMTVALMALTVVALGLVVTPASAATIAVHCPSQSLQAKVNAAAPGSTLSITGTCHVNATINKDLTLQGNPTATLDGDDLGSTITISGTPTVHLTHLVVTGGRSAQGGGIDIAGGTVTLLHVTVQDNLAEGSSAQGGGIYSAGTVKVVQSTIAHNRAAASASGGAANGDGGGIESTGHLTVTASTISSNRATSNSTGNGGGSFGGGILVQSGVLTVTSSHLTGNHVEGTSDTNMIQVGGGAIADVAAGSSVTITGSTFDQNAAVSVGHNSAPVSSFGRAALFAVKTATVKTSTFTGNSAASASDNDDAESEGGALDAIMGLKVTLTGLTVRDSTVRAHGADTVRAVGGAFELQGTVSIASSSIAGNSADAEGGTTLTEAVGGGIHASVGAKLTVTRTTVADNDLLGRSPSPQALAIGAGIASEDPTVVQRTTVSGNTSRAVATSAVTPAAASEGGGLFMSAGPSTVTDSTIAGNLARSTAPAAGTSVSVGGGILFQASSSLTLLATTLARNVIEGSGGTVSAAGGWIYASVGTTTFHASILELNIAPTKADGPNCAKSVTFQSGGHNLLGTTSGCMFAKLSSDKVNVANPGLGPLAHNGGPTETIAFTNASPARNAFAPPCPAATDQRGVHRPQGPRCDIGAFERS